jgi:hypothetical protein
MPVGTSDTASSDGSNDDSDSETDAVAFASPSVNASTGLFDEAEFFSVSSLASTPTDQPLTLLNSVAQSPAETRKMAYDVPVDLTFEQLMQLKAETLQELASVRLRVDQASGDAKSDQRDVERRLEWKANTIETTLNRADAQQLRGIVDKHSEEIRELKGGVGKLAEKQANDTAALGDRVAFIEEFCMQLHNQQDALTNDFKEQNALVFGMFHGPEDEALDIIFEHDPAGRSAVDVAFFLNNDPSKTE